MECNNTRTDIEHHHERKRARTDKTSIPPHQKDPTPSSSPNGDSGTPTTEKTGPRTGTPLDTDQVMDDQAISNTRRPSWGDEENRENQEAPLTQTDLLESLHKSLESATEILNRLSIHATYPESTLILIRELHRRFNKTKPSEEKKPSDDILSAIQRLAKDVEELKRATPTSTPSTVNPARSKDVFATGPTIKPKPKPTPIEQTQTPVQPNNPWQRHHPARLILQIPSTVDPSDRLGGMKAVEAANAALTPHTKASIIAVKWNDKGNCIAITHPDYNATDLEPFGNIIATAITGTDNIECTATPDRKWHRIILNGVDTGKLDIDDDIELSHFQGRHSSDILKELKTNNPSLATISITEARWLTRPETLREKSHSSTILTVSSQEDVELLMRHIRRVIMYGRLASFSRYQDTKPIKQCLTCWAYGHLKCNKGPKCRTCAGDHKESDHTCLECPQSENNHTQCTHMPSKCANCNGQHPADDTRCPTRIALIGTTRTPTKGGRLHNNTPTSNKPPQSS